MHLFSLYFHYTISIFLICIRNILLFMWRLLNWKIYFSAQPREKYKKIPKLKQHNIWLFSTNKTMTDNERNSSLTMIKNIGYQSTKSISTLQCNKLFSSFVISNSSRERRKKVVWDIGTLLYLYLDWKWNKNVLLQEHGLFFFSLNIMFIYSIGHNMNNVLRRENNAQ